MTRSSLILLCGLLVACPVAPVMELEGLGTVDAGAADGGSTDAGADDAGVPLDAGLEPDAGQPCVLPVTPGPVRYGARVLHDLLHDAGVDSCVRVLTMADVGAAAVLGAQPLSPKPEAFAVVLDGARVSVVGRDARGAMYGALELAERVRGGGRAAFPPPQPRSSAPDVPVRAANVFLILPEAGEPWYLLEHDYWTQLLDTMAWSRLNLLDLHGMYNLGNTGFPNALLYFTGSSTYPMVGAPPDERTRNQALLRWLVDAAMERGIDVGLMNYRSDLSLTADRADWPLPDDGVKTYTREAVAELGRQVPNLKWLGFRIGESNRPTSWYADTFVTGLRQASSTIRPSTRSWGSSKPEILWLVDAGAPDLMVQAKFNGEQLAAPYAVTGGTISHPGYGHYSYETYLEPPMPYTFVFQVRSAGTHRIFRYASYQLTKRTMPTLLARGVAGFTLELPNAFLPQRDFYHAPADRFSEWTFRRDELMLQLFGRLGWDAQTPEQVFRDALRFRVGTDELWAPVQAASEIVPWIQQGMTCGWDHRDYAPDLELGGSIGDWATPVGTPQPFACVYHAPFDRFSIASPAEFAVDLVARRPTTKLSPLEIAAQVTDAADRARRAGTVVVDQVNAEARDVVRESLALGSLGAVFAHRLRASSALAVYQRTGAADYLATARAEAALASMAYGRLVTETAHIQPFEEHLRMRQLGLATFHWRFQQAALANDVSAIDAAEAAVRANPPVFTGVLPTAASLFATRRPAAPSIRSVVVDPSTPEARDRAVTIEFERDLDPSAGVRLFAKRFANVTEYQPVPMVALDGGTRAFTTSVRLDGPGALFVFEVTTDGGAWRLPDLLQTTPYVVVPSSP